MGMFDNIKNFFSRGSNSNQSFEDSFSIEDPMEKLRLAKQIMNKVDQIKKINSFDTSVLNFRYMSPYDLANRSMKELEAMDAQFSNKLSSLSNRSKSYNNDEYQKALWTGTPMKGQTKDELSRAQERDD